MFRIWKNDPYKEHNVRVSHLVLECLKGNGRRIALAGMKEATQRARAEAVINSADLAKWKAAVRSIGDYDALDIISAIASQGLPRRFDDFEVRLGD
jgi:hypothetical protein